MSLSPLLRTALTLLGALALPSCLEPTCDKNGNDRDPIPYTGGSTNPAKTFYETSPPVGPYLRFPPGETLQLVHELGRIPNDVSTFVAFRECPLPDPDGLCSNDPVERGEVTESAGNQVVLQDLNAAFIEVRNDTCGEVFLRVTASVD